jgi:hypothetical protein
MANADVPPELEVRFDMEPNSIYGIEDPDTPLPVNWALRFVHNQLFKYFVFPSRFCPGAFHSTIVRKCEFRSAYHRNQYIKKCDAVLKKWREAGPKPLNEGGWDVDGKKLKDPPECTSGIWLFKDRNTITHFFPPNFLPPYDTPEKRKIIADCLKQEWDERTLSWQPIGKVSRPFPKGPIATGVPHQPTKVEKTLEGTLSGFEAAGDKVMDTISSSLKVIGI